MRTEDPADHTAPHTSKPRRLDSRANLQRRHRHRTRTPDPPTTRRYPRSGGCPQPSAHMPARRRIRSRQRENIRSSHWSDPPAPYRRHGRRRLESPDRRSASPHRRAHSQRVASARAKLSRGRFDCKLSDAQTCHGRVLFAAPARLTVQGRGASLDTAGLWAVLSLPMECARVSWTLTAAIGVTGRHTARSEHVIELEAVFVGGAGVAAVTGRPGVLARHRA